MAKSGFDRRKFLKLSSAAIVAGAIGVPKIPNAWAAEGKGKLPHLPWGKHYVELDPEYVRKLGHLGFYMFECAGGLFWAIMTALSEKVGYPFTTLNLPTKEEVIEGLEMDEEFVIPMQYGYAGIMGFGTVCGTVNASAMVVNFLMSPKSRTAKKIIHKVIRYYEATPFPSQESNRYAVEHKFLVPKYKSDKALPQSISHSPLCHVSVSKWCIKSGYGAGSKERSERCARLVGDMAHALVTLLNANLKGQLDAVMPLTFSQGTVECMKCHHPGKNYEKGEIIKGEMECTTCHRDLRPHMAENKLKTVFGIEAGTLLKSSVAGAVAGIGAHAVARRIGGGKDEQEKDEG